MSTAVHTLTKTPKDSLLHVDVAGNFPLDEAVVAALPSTKLVLSANSFGSSAWTVTARIDTISKDGALKVFFLKCATDDVGRGMMEGEYNAMKDLYKTMPTLVPEPHAWGIFKIPQPETYFFLCDFIEMRNQLPDPARLCSRIAELHRVSHSPTGKFGFHIPTYHGKFPQSVQWNDNWASFFRNLLEDALIRDVKINGSWPEFERVSERTLNKVIPRLLGILQQDGRDIKPCLIHGDLWEGNIGTSYGDNAIVIFDSGAYYAHNEMEIGMWRCVRHHISSKSFTRQYFREYPVSEPAEEWDDRNRMYCVKMNIVHSAHHKGDIVRQTAFEDMCYLVDKYAPWEKD